MLGRPPLKALGLAGAALGAGVAGLWWQVARRPLPRTAGTVHVRGLSDPVTIRRDRWGVPHVSARSGDDAWFGQGFCHGQDRLWQLDLYRRLACGRLAEISGDPGLAADRFVRTLGLRRIALAEEEALGEELGSALAAYSAGINAAVEAAAALPVEFQLLRTGFEPWRPADTLTLTKLLALGLSTNWERELIRADMVRDLGPELAARLDPGYPEGNPVALEPGSEWRGAGIALSAQIDVLREALGLAPEATGSNNWAVSPRRSATGTALLAGDPHLPPSMPGITYELGLEVGGSDLPRRLVPRPDRDCIRPERRRRLVVHQHDGRRHGSVRRAGARRAVRVPRRAAATLAHRGVDRGQGALRARAAHRPRHPSRPARQRGPARRPRRTAGAELDRARGALRDRGQPCGAARCAAARSWLPRWRPTMRRSRTWSGPIGGVRSATR